MDGTACTLHTHIQSEMKQKDGENTVEYIYIDELPGDGLSQSPSAPLLLLFLLLPLLLLSIASVKHEERAFVVVCLYLCCEYLFFMM